MRIDLNTGANGSFDGPTVWANGSLITLMFYLGNDKWEAIDEEGDIKIVATEHFGRAEGQGTVLYPLALNV